MHAPSSQFVLSRLAVTLLGCLLALGAGGCQKPASKPDAVPQPPPPISVRVQTVTPSQSSQNTEVVGSLEAVQRATISAKVTGTIAEMPVTLGAMVKQGDLLVKISAAEISARLSQAETAVTQAKRNLEREQRLLAQNASTRETVNTQEDAYQLAKAGLNEARTMLGYTTLRAPFAGMIASKTANAGDLATAGAPLLVLENTASLQAVISVPEAQVLALTPGATLPLRIPAANMETTGTVAEISPSADAASRTATVKCDLPAHPSLRPGQFVRVALPGQASQTLRVPSTSLSLFGQMERLFVVEDNVARLRLVRSGQSQDGQTEILAGLKPGERLVIQADRQLSDGHPVQVQP